MYQTVVHELAIKLQAKNHVKSTKIPWNAGILIILKLHLQGPAAAERGGGRGLESAPEGGDMIHGEISSWFMLVHVGS